MQRDQMEIDQWRDALQREVLTAEVVQEAKVTVQQEDLLDQDLEAGVDLVARAEVVAEVDHHGENEEEEVGAGAESAKEKQGVRAHQRKLNLPKCWVCLDSLPVHDQKT